MYHGVSVCLVIIGNGLWEAQFLVNNLWKVEIGCLGKYCEPINTLLNHFWGCFLTYQKFGILRSSC